VYSSEPILRVLRCPYVLSIGVFLITFAVAAVWWLEIIDRETEHHRSLLQLASGVAQQRIQSAMESRLSALRSWARRGAEVGQAQFNAVDPNSPDVLGVLVYGPSLELQETYGSTYPRHYRAVENLHSRLRLRDPVPPREFRWTAAFLPAGEFAEYPVAVFADRDREGAILAFVRSDKFFENGCQPLTENRYRVEVLEAGVTVFDNGIPAAADLKESRTVRAGEGIFRVRLYSSAHTAPGHGLSELIAAFGFAIATLLSVGVWLTLRKRSADAQLLESERRWGSMVEHAPFGMGITTRDNRLISANPALCDLLGYSESELAGRDLLSITHPDDLQSTSEALNALQRSDAPCQYQKRYVTKGGEAVWVCVTSAAVQGGTGSQEYGIHIIENISAQKKAEHARCEAEQITQRTEGLLRAVYEASPFAIVSLNADAKVTSWNPAAERMFGWTEPEVLGCRLPVVANASADETGKVWRTLDGERCDGVEARRLRKDGSFIDVAYWTAPQGHSIPADGVIIAYADLTERKRLEQQFLHAQKMEAVGRLAGGVAHDFNNLLTIINGYSALTLELMKEDDPLREHVETVEQAGGRAASLTRRLLAFSRRLVLQPKTVILNDVLLGVDKMLRRLIGEDIELVTSLSPSLSWVRVDPQQMEHVIVNIAVNARDAMPRGGKLTIETTDVEVQASHPPVDGMPAGLYVMLSIADTGCGMSPETLQRIFEPFFTTKEPGRGTGLGLSTVYGIVKQSGGHIAVDTEAGVGTCFRIYLPVVEADSTFNLTANTAAPSLPRGVETILVVEDEDIVRELTCRILERCGYTVLTASGGAEALRKAKTVNGGIDLLLTDVVMPEMSGPELGERFARVQPQASLMFMSGYTEDSMFRHGMPAGIVLLEKPFSPQALADTVRKVLDERAVPAV
jgi:PAS domain S-box-containing protein